MTDSCIRQFADKVQIKACKENIKKQSPSISPLTKLLSLAGNEVRFKILFLLHTESKLCVCDMSDILEMNISAISQHLRKLKDAGMVDANREAQTLFYYISPNVLDVIEPLFAFISIKNTQEV